MTSTSPLRHRRDISSRAVLFAIRLVSTKRPVSILHWRLVGYAQKLCEMVFHCLFTDDARHEGRRMQYEREGRLPPPCIEFERSSAVCGSGETGVIFERIAPRQQINLITAYMDASQVHCFREVLEQEVALLFTGLRQ